MIYAINPKGTLQTIFRIMIILLAFALIVISIWIKVYIIFILCLYLIFLALLIQQRNLEVYDDYFVINSRCWLRRFNKKSEYYYSDIKKVKFSPGYTNWKLMILVTMMGTYKYGEGLAARSEWKIIKTNNSVEYIKSIGTDKQAEKVADFINARLTNNE